jgi:hypothetical protein
MIAIIDRQSSLGRTRVAGRLLALTLATAALLVMGAASAQASSLVYTHENNVWLANPDGSGQYQVTLDGTAGEPYTSPSQAQDGTIEAVRGKKLYRMTQNGTLLNAPFATLATLAGFGPEDALISPDGSKVSFWTQGIECEGCFGPAYSYQVSYSDHFVPPGTFGTGRSHVFSLRHPTWLGNSRELLFSHDGTVEYYELNKLQTEQWFEWQNLFPGTEAGFWEEGAASGDGTRLALLTEDNGGNYAIEIYSAAGDLASGNPPAKPTPRCDIFPPDGSAGSTAAGSLFDSLSWSPDGSSLAFGYNGAIYVASLPNLETCEGPEKQVIPAGSDPNWGPANVNPAPRPSGNPAPPIVQPPPVVRLTLTSLAQTHRVWREGNKLAQISRPRKRPPIGTTFSFSLNEQAFVGLRFTQELSGRKVGRRCVAKTPKNAKRTSCMRTVTAGTLSLTGHAGTNTVGFQGRVSPTRRLGPGHYTLIVTTTNSAAVGSAPASLSFTIVK